MKKIWIPGIVVGLLVLTASLLILYSYQKSAPTQTIIDKPIKIDLKK